MQFRGQLMIEHRLIERMIALIDREVQKIERTRVVDHMFLDVAADFLRTYADRTHHGKEEDILFRELSRKKLSSADDRIMHELVQEHIVGRTTTAGIVEASAAYRKGDRSALPAIVENLKRLADYYPKHIEKEDLVFFPAAMLYFSESEQQSMLNEFLEFDRKMIHEKYKSIVKTQEG